MYGLDIVALVGRPKLTKLANHVLGIASVKFFKVARQDSDTTDETGQTIATVAELFAIALQTSESQGIGPAGHRVLDDIT
jgi:hypothetical protein